MPSFERGDVVRVPFPNTDRSTRQRRPALVVSDGTVGDADALIWVVMITSAANRPWAGDVPLGETSLAAGLPAPSVIRPAKIATIDSRHAEAVGHVEPAILSRVTDQLRALLGIDR